jgi:hypothetical protein
MSILDTITLSKPSKMPGHAYGIPAAKCHTGAKLRKVEGSTCSHCYALKGNYGFPSVKTSQARRLEAIDVPGWIDRMVDMIDATGDAHFRWHDSGDLQSPEHLARIVTIAKALPHVRFWLPTREYALIRDWLFDHPEGFPANLNVRLSAHMVGQRMNPVPGVTASSVDAKEGHACPAPQQGNACGDCRACWDKSVPNVDYHRH